MRAVWAAVLVALCACSPAVPALPTPTATAVIRPTLPPTWTPTFTPSPAPPTPTLTPTRTFTPAPTRSAESLCADFWLETTLDSKRFWAWDQTITLFANLPAPDVGVRLRATHRQSGEQREWELPAGSMLLLQLPVKNLPLAGRYAWTLSLYSESYGEFCQQSGWFVTLRREATEARERRTR
jgi:hypothetical protein